MLMKLNDFLLKLAGKTYIITAKSCWVFKVLYPITDVTFMWLLNTLFRAAYEDKKPLTQGLACRTSNGLLGGAKNAQDRPEETDE